VSRRRPGACPYRKLETLCPRCASALGSVRFSHPYARVRRRRHRPSKYRSLPSRTDRRDPRARAPAPRPSETKPQNASVSAASIAGCGCCCHECGPVGAGWFRSSRRTPSSPGTARASRCTGTGDPGRVERAVPRLRRASATSSDRCRKPTRSGAHRGSTRNG
jgi:hypothetical protein